MRDRFLRRVSPVLLGIALGFLAVAPSSAGTPLENIEGEYAGTLKYRDHVIDTSEEVSGGGSLDIGFSTTQEGNFLNPVLLFKATGEDEAELFVGEGRAGNGKLWFRADTEEGVTVVFAGTMKGAPGKRVIKAKGFYLSDTEYADIKVALKEGDSGIEK